MIQRRALRVVPFAVSLLVCAPGCGSSSGALAGGGSGAGGNVGSAGAGLTESAGSTAAGATSGGAGITSGGAGMMIGMGGGGAGATIGVAGGGSAGQAGGVSSAGNGGLSGGGGSSGVAGGGAAAGGGAGVSAAGMSGTDDPCGSSNPAVVPLPVIGSGSFTIGSYGAVGDGKTDNTTAIQAALTAAANAGGGTVTVPSGTFLSGPIVIGNSTRLELAAGSVLEMLPMSQYPNQNAFITCKANSHDIAITGSGTIEGQGQAWWNALTATPTLVRPQEVNLGHVTRVEISGIRLQNSPEEHIWVKSDTDVTVTGITISTLAVSGQHIPNNTDGVDINATGVFFCNNNIACGDDNVVMDGKNIYVAYSNFGAGHGCTIGSGTTDGVSAVTVDHIVFNGTTAGVRMKSARDRGGLVQNLTYSNLTMTNVQDPIFITSYYPTMPTDPTTDTAQPITGSTPYWENITIKNLTATGSANGGILWGLPEAKISNVVLDNVKIQAKTGMEIFHATGVKFSDGSTITPTTGPAVEIYDATVSGVTTTAY